MTAAPQLRLAASAGHALGMGHALRCVALAGEARRRGWSVELALRADEPARAAVAAELGSVALRAWDGPESLFDCGALVLDTRDEIWAELREARRRGAASLVLDRVDCLDAADWTVLPVLHACLPEHPRVRGGAAYCVVPRAVREAAVPTDPMSRRGVIVSLGGADPQGITQRLVEVLGACLAGVADPPQPRDVAVVIGPAFAEPDALVRRVGALGFEGVLRPPQRELAARMACARFALVGFGATASELAFLGVPCLVFAHRRQDVADCARFEALGFGASAGFGGDLDPQRLARLLERTLGDAAWCERAGARARRALGDGGGAGRILDLLEGARRPQRGEVPR